MSGTKKRGSDSILARQQHAIATALRNTICAQGHFQQLMYNISKIIDEQDDMSHREDMVAILNQLSNLQRNVQITEQLIRLRAASIKRRNEEDRKFKSKVKKVKQVFADTISD